MLKWVQCLRKNKSEGRRALNLNGSYGLIHLSSKTVSEETSSRGGNTVYYFCYYYYEKDIKIMYLPP
jgi:hypothetical protein